MPATAKYEKIYRSQRRALGEPTETLVAFFRSLRRHGLKVLDLGCGQGRDALFIARLGHPVTGVDISAAGVEQMLEDARRDNLRVQGVVADLVSYHPEGDFDIILFDRTLHMLASDVRLKVLARAAHHLRTSGYLLIADEQKNMPAMRAIVADPCKWHILKDEKAFLFAQKVGQAA